MRTLINVALGNEQADLVLKNGNIVDVFNHTTKCADVAIKNGKIVGIGEYSCDNEIDVSGKFVLPGLIDAHVHIESSLMIPSEYAKAVLPKGVTTLIADSHEIVNVCGENGLAFMIENGKGLPIDIEFMLPSCVPATPFDNAGCVIDSKKTKELFEKYNLRGLGEMMNYPGVIACVDDVLEKLEVAEIIDGHAPGLGGKQLCAYLCGGIATDHECSSAEEALEKIGCGLKVLIREGTGAKNLEQLIKAVTPYNLQHFAFCTDDKHTDEILCDGTIGYCVKKASMLGLDSISAIKIATYNPAQIYNLKNKGAIAPGYVADIVVADSLELDKIEMVFKNGRLVAKDDEPLFSTEKADISTVTDTVHIPEITPQALELEFNPEMPVISMQAGSLFTEAVYEKTADGLLYCANIERHKGTGNIGKAFLKGFNLKNGAVAQSIGHDCHNISVVGDNTADMALAVNSLGKKGGIAVVDNGRLACFMELPVAGIMTDLPAEEVAQQFELVNRAINSISDNASNSIFMVLSFISLLVIPSIKLGDKGLFDVDKFRYM